MVNKVVYKCINSLKCC